MTNKRPCKWCLKEVEEHEDWRDMKYFFCMGQIDLPPEVMDFYEPCTNLQYLAYRYEKKRIK